MDGEGVWHVVDAPAAKWIGYALRCGAEPAGAFTTYEVPGHHACMLYAAVACPFLASPAARRTFDGVAPAHVSDPVPAGTRRGTLSGVAQFAACTVRTLPAGGYEVELMHPRVIHTYRSGAELLPLLQEAIDTEPQRPAPPNDLFGPDERIIKRELRRTLKARPHVASTGPVRR
ncbi:hypothetical protein [Amycolatopsis anabasis]|uniref:hypothetical protein n=1 Tax=Amycolatopsis anabasis TaxID=1840409 RepID=UPI00131C1113|nr:hypothetical protein [Amycolatopsis anabasis]